MSVPAARQSAMIIDEKEAMIFIEAYKAFLLSMKTTKSRNLYQQLWSGIFAYKKNRDLFNEYRRSIVCIDQKVADAIQVMRYSTWLLIKQTRKYAIFMDLSSRNLYGVCGLTQPLNDIIEGTFFTLECGLMNYKNKIVFDGLIRRPVYLGKNYRKSYGIFIAKLNYKEEFAKTSLSNLRLHLTNFICCAPKMEACEIAWRILGCGSPRPEIADKAQAGAVFSRAAVCPS
jgi:hypothetical protein